MQYTLVITSCGRHNLLKQTWDLFQASRDIAPRETIIVEDGPAGPPDWLPRHNVTWLSNGARRGQIYSIDRAYQQVKTEYIFHAEDDWGFGETGFIQDSLDILEKYPDILQVWLRGIPSHQERQNSWTIYNVEPHPTHPGVFSPTYHWEGWQGGFSFNPGLRRLSDYSRIGSYGRHVGYDPRGCGERALGRLYHSLGYSAAILPKRYLYHIGDEAHVDRKANPPAPKILIAVPTSDNLDYSLFRKMQQKTWGRVWENGVSGLQIDGPNPRKKAVEETWFKDAAAFPNITAKFFTGPDLGVPDDHVHMPLKMRAICQWMVEHDFDLMFRPDDDTYVDMALLARQGMEFDKDYGGVDQGGFVIGGPGIWMSRKACSLIANSECPDYNTEWRDDAWMGQVLKAAGIPLTDLPMTVMEENIVLGPIITRHPVSPERMRELWLQQSTLSPAS